MQVKTETIVNCFKKAGIREFSGADYAAAAETGAGDLADQLARDALAGRAARGRGRGGAARGARGGRVRRGSR